MQITKGQKLVMIGDSITDCGRKRPVGEGIHGGLGTGYVSLVDAFLTSTYPELRVNVVNMGIGGNTVRDLKARWQTDALDLAPDWLSIMIGINDVWRQFDQPFITASHVYPEEYEKTLRELVEMTKTQVKNIVLMSPFYIEPNTSDLMRGRMDEYRQMVALCAKETGCIYVDVQAAFDQLLTHLYPAALAWDRVHPNITGHLVIAKAFLAAVAAEV